MNPATMAKTLFLLAALLGLLLATTGSVGANVAQDTANVTYNQVDTAPAVNITHVSGSGGADTEAPFEISTNMGARILWSADESGSYTIVRGADCASGTLFSGHSGPYTSGTPMESLLALALLDEGPYTVHVCVTDAASNTGLASAQVTLDKTSPVVTLATPANGSSTTDSTPTFSGTAGTAVGDSPTVTVEIFKGPDTNSPGAGSLTAAVGEGGAYSVEGLSLPLAVGTYTARTFQLDLAGNYTDSNSNTFTILAPDTTAPAVNINQASGQLDPTSTSPINFTVVFSEPVTGFEPADVTLSGVAGATATVSPSGDGMTYTVAVSGMTAGGTVMASIPAAVATDAAGNGNLVSTSTDNTVTFVTAPAITSGASATFTVGSTGRFTVTTTGNPTPSLGQSGNLPKGVTFTDNGNGTASLTGSPEPGSAGTYNLTFTASNGVSPDATQAFTLIVSRTEDASPVVTIQPQAQTVLVGGTATFAAAASGNPSPTVQWQELCTGTGCTWSNVPNAISTTLTLSNVTLAMTNYQYRAVFTNSLGSATTAPATLTVNAAAGTGSIAGKLFNDANGNGILDKGEAALAGWIVQLQDGSGATAQTGSSGDYKFTGLEADTYKLGIVLQPGYVQTTPDPTDITLAEGQAVTGVNFGAALSADLKVEMAANYNAKTKVIVYTITVTNDGPAEAAGTTLTDVLPNGVSYDSATTSAGTCSLAKTTVTCTLGTLASGSSANITLKVTRTDVKKAITNTATVSSSTFDIDKSDNSATAIVP